MCCVIPRDFIGCVLHFWLTRSVIWVGQGVIAIANFNRTQRSETTAKALQKPKTAKVPALNTFAEPERNLPIQKFKLTPIHRLSNCNQLFHRSHLISPTRRSRPITDREMGPPKSVRTISQQAFEGLVKENMEDLGMDPTEALEDAIQTLTLQGVDLSGQSLHPFKTLILKISAHGYQINTTRD